MKAIHNTYTVTIDGNGTVFNISKIQNESNSQQCTLTNVYNFDCVQYFKDTK